MQEHVILLWQIIPFEISQPRLYNSNKLFLLEDQPDVHDADGTDKIDK